MNAKYVRIVGRLFWEQEEADGSECCCCGDRCYLSMWRLMVSFAKLSKVGTSFVTCQSCVPMDESSKLED